MLSCALGLFIGVLSAAEPSGVAARNHQQGMSRARVDEPQLRDAIETRVLAEVAQQEAQELRARQQALESSLRDLSEQVRTGSLLIAVMVTLAGFFGWSAARKWATRRLDERLKEALAASLPDQIARLANDAKNELLRTAQVLALHAQKAYDDALMVFGGPEDLTKLKAAPVVLRRALIDSLYHCKANRDDNRARAWTLLSELSLEDETVETLRLFVQLAGSYRKYEEGARFYQQVCKKHPALAKDHEAGIRASTLLRKLGRTADALALANTFRETKDYDVLVEIAALQRDQGDFHGAADLLRPLVKKIIETQDSALPKAWKHIVTTFIAVCIDLRRWEEVYRPAGFVMQKAPSAVEIFTIGNFLLKCPDGGQDAAQMVAQMARIASELESGEATVRVNVVLRRLEGKHEEAAATAADAIKQADEKRKSRDAYHLRAMLGLLLSDLGRHEEACDVLVPAVSLEYGGEAKYNLAIVCARRGLGADAVRWLKAAANEIPKWRMLARDQADLNSRVEVQAWLHNLAADTTAKHERVA